MSNTSRKHKAHRMDIEAARRYCIGKPHATECFPFDEINLVFKVAGKMFALLPLDLPDMITLKCDPEYALELREHYPDIIEPAYHFNKRYWNQHHLHAISDEVMCHLIDHSYEEVVKKLPKKTRLTMGL